jgi:Ni/Co efflux regulator RcnB
MKKNAFLGLAIGIALSFALAAPEAQARNDHGREDHGRGHDKQGHERNRERNWHDPVVYRGGKRVYYIPNDERVLIRNYYVERYPCPPGHAKRGRGCIGEQHPRYGRDRHYKVRYVIGQPLPEDVVYAEVPQPLLVRLGGPYPQPGLRYVQVDDDVLLISEATRKVIDAVTLFSAVD